MPSIHVEIQKKRLGAEGIKFFVEEQGKEVARAYFYLLIDDLNPEPIGFMREVYIIREDYGSLLVENVVKEAKQRGCYKLICASRHGSRIQELLKKSGFKGFGLEFRMDFY